MYRQHKKLRQLLTLTAFSLDPSEELFKFVDLLHNVLNDESDGETDESASTIITADVDSDKGGKDRKETKGMCVKLEDTCSKSQGSKTDNVLVKSDPTDNAKSQKSDGIDSMQADQNSQAEMKGKTTERMPDAKLNTPDHEPLQDGEVFEKKADSQAVVNGDIAIDLSSKEKVDESGLNNSLDEELECLPLCKKHGCCSKKTGKAVVCEQKPVEGMEVEDSVVSILEPVEKTKCQCKGKETCGNSDQCSKTVLENDACGSAVNNTMDTENGDDSGAGNNGSSKIENLEPMETDALLKNNGEGEQLPAGDGDAPSVKNDSNAEEPIEDTCTVFQRDVDDIPEIVSCKAKKVSRGGTNSGSFSASFEQWLIQNSGKGDIMVTPEEQAPPSTTTEVAEGSPSTNNEETTESSTTNENNLEEMPDSSSTTEIESVKDDLEPVKRNGPGRRRKNGQEKCPGVPEKSISSRTRASGKRKGSDDDEDEDEDSEAEKRGGRRRRKVVKYEEYCTDESESSTAESDVETETEEDIHGVVVPGVNKKVLCELLCICDRLRDDSLNPDLPWVELRDRCLNIFGSGIVKQEPEVKQEVEEPRPPVHFIEPSDVIEAKPVVVSQPMQEEKLPVNVVTTSVTVDITAAAAVVPPVEPCQKVSQNRRKKPNSANVPVGKVEKKVKKILPSGIELGEKHFNSNVCVPAGMALERANYKCKTLHLEEAVNTNAKWASVNSVKMMDSVKQNVNDSLIVSRTTSAFQKLDTTKPRPKILLNKKSPHVSTKTAEPSQVLPSHFKPCVPLVDQFHVPVPTTRLSTSVETPLVSPMVCSSEIKLDTSGSIEVPASVQTAVTMASAILRKPAVAAPVVSVKPEIIQVPDSNGAIVSAYQTAPNVVYRTDTPSPSTECPQFVALQGQHGQQQIVLLKSPAGQTVTYTASGGKVYKIWNSKNYSRYNVGQGQRIVGIRPLVRTPSPEIGEITSTGSPISQTAPPNFVATPAQGSPISQTAPANFVATPTQGSSISQTAPANFVATPTQASPGITPTLPVIAMSVPHPQSAPNFAVVSTQNLTSHVSMIPPVVTLAHSQPLSVVETQPVGQTRKFSVAQSQPLSVAKIQSKNITPNWPVSVAQTQPSSVAQIQPTNITPNRPITVAQSKPLTVTPTQQLSNLTFVQSPVSGTPTMPNRSGNVPVFAGQNPGNASGMDISYVGTYPDGTSESDILNQILKQATTTNVSLVQRTTPSAKVQNSAGTVPKAQTVKAMLHNQAQTQHHAALLKQQQAAKIQFSNADARIRNLLQNTVVQTAGHDGQVLISRNLANPQYNTNALITGVKQTSMSNSAVQTNSPVANNAALTSIHSQKSVGSVKAIPSNQLLVRQALQNQQRNLTAGAKQLIVDSATAMLQKNAHTNVQHRNQEIIVLSDSDSDSDYRRRNEKRVTYSKKDREPVLSVLAKTLTENLMDTSLNSAQNQLRQQLCCSSNSYTSQMASLVANSRTLMDQVVRTGSTKPATIMNQVVQSAGACPTADPKTICKGRGRGQPRKPAPKKAQQEKGVNVRSLPLQGQVQFAVEKKSAQSQNAGFRLDISGRIDGVPSIAGGVIPTQTPRTGQTTSPVRTIPVPGGVPVQNVEGRSLVTNLQQPRPVSPVPQCQSVYLGQKDCTSPRILLNVVNDSPITMAHVSQAVLSASIPIPVASLPPN
jgi:hypothetical protein